MGFYAFTLASVPGSIITPPINLSGSGVTELFGANTTGDTNERVQLGADGSIRWGSGAGAVDTRLFRSAAGALQQSTGAFQLSAGSLDVQLAGQGLQVSEGSGTNAKQGTFTLAGAATTTVSNTTVTANSRILLTCQTLGTVTAASTLAVSARSAGTSFTVTPSQATDTSVIAFEIFEPG